MPELTSSSVNDARDAEDRRLLEAGDHRVLVESYYGVMIERCTLKLRSRQQGVDAAGAVAVRLLSELKRGKTYGGLPFRVVVHQVIGWVCKGWTPDGKEGAELVDVDEPVWDASDVEILDHLGWLTATCTEAEREVVMLRWWEQLEIEEIAVRLGIERNAVDQRLHRASKKMRRRLEEE